MSEEQTEAPKGAEGLLAIGWYAYPLWRKLLTALKYQSAWCLEEAFVSILKRLRQERRATWPWAQETYLLIVPIPADPKRVRVRGFDHTQFLARLVQRVLVPWAEMSPVLQKTKKTFSNARLPADARRQLNIQGAFSCMQPITKPVLLIDDIFTTGATLEEGIRALRVAGCPRVFVLTFARSETAHDHQRYAPPLASLAS